jgi:hypothetical protein
MTNNTGDLLVHHDDWIRLADTQSQLSALHLSADLPAHYVDE